MTRMIDCDNGVYRRSKACQAHSSFDIRQETWTTWGQLDWLDDKTRMHMSADIDRCLTRESILEEFEEFGQSNS
jgi:hypothetical protein